MSDSDDVLLLKPLDEAAGFILGDRAPPGASGAGVGQVIGGVHVLTGPDDPLPERFRREAAHPLRAAGAASVAALVTESSPNTFPRLPVREGGSVLVWLATFAEPAPADAAASIFPDRSLQRLRLEPTARSRLHG